MKGFENLRGRVLDYCQDPLWRHACLVFEKGLVLLDSASGVFSVQKVFPNLVQDNHSEWHISVDVHGYVILMGARKDTGRVSRLVTIPPREEPRDQGDQGGFWTVWRKDNIGIRNQNSIWSWRSWRHGTVAAFSGMRESGVSLGAFRGTNQPISLDRLRNPERVLESWPIWQDQNERILVWSQKGQCLQLHSAPHSPLGDRSRAWTLLAESDLPPNWEIVDVHPNLPSAILKNGVDGRHAVHRVAKAGEGFQSGFQFGADSRWSWHRLSTLPCINSGDNVSLFDWRGGLIFVKASTGEVPDVTQDCR